MKDYPGIGIPVGKTRKQLKAKKDRADAKALQAFRMAVWIREGVRFAYAYREGYKMGRCAHCGAPVTCRDDQPQTGEVHHRIGRRHKATRYDPANGVLLCNHLVNNCHAKAEAGLIDV